MWLDRELQCHLPNMHRCHCRDSIIALLPIITAPLWYGAPSTYTYTHMHTCVHACFVPVMATQHIKNIFLVYRPHSYWSSVRISGLLSISKPLDPPVNLLSTTSRLICRWNTSPRSLTPLPRSCRQQLVIPASPQYSFYGIRHTSPPKTQSVFHSS